MSRFSGGVKLLQTNLPVRLPCYTQLCYSINSQSLPLHFHAFSASRLQLYRSLGTRNNNAAPAADVGRAKGRIPRASAPAKTSLRRVAVEAERSRGGLNKGRNNHTVLNNEGSVKVIRGYCAAEQYDIQQAAAILQGVGYILDPSQTNLYPKVLHVRTAGEAASRDGNGQPQGDIFIFPSGTVVAWNVDDAAVSDLVSTHLRPAAEKLYLGKLETEDLEYIENPDSDQSKVVGDAIRLGTKAVTNVISDEAVSHSDTGSSSKGSAADQHSVHQHEANLVLTKIAFSSGLAKSVKLAVLEETLEVYFQSTRSIPHMMASGSRLPFTRRFILRKTGELLNARSQLNLNSELTDGLPDMFWDSRHELGLEGYFDQVGRALDVNARSRVLNQKMDYAQEIVSVLREQLSERHGLKLEWLIIALIAIEVMFEIHRLVKHYYEEREEKNN